MKNPVGSIIWFEIPANNVKRAQKFYKAMFGWKISKMPGMGFFVVCMDTEKNVFAVWESAK